MYYGDVSIHDLFKGQSVTFLGRGGYDSDKFLAFRSGLRVGEVYQVSGFEIGGWRSEITLEGFGKVKFNSVMFGYDDVATVVRRAWLNAGCNWGNINQAKWIAMLDRAKKELDLIEKVGLDSEHVPTCSDDFFREKANESIDIIKELLAALNDIKRVSLNVGNEQSLRDANRFVQNRVSSIDRTMRSAGRLMKQYEKDARISSNDFFDKLDVTSWQKVMANLNAVSDLPVISVTWSESDSQKE